jgi:hypothetical protein
MDASRTRHMVQLAPWDRGQVTCPRCDDTLLDGAAYAYLLGLYLGDGYIDRMPRTYRMRIFQDQRYVLLIELARGAMARVRRSTPSKVSIVPQTGCVAVVAYWNHWPACFRSTDRVGSTDVVSSWSRGRWT